MNLLESDDWEFLETIAASVVEASRVAPGGGVGKIGPNTTGGTLIRPGGRDCYPAFWIRDYAMSLESGFITPEEQRHALLLTARCQQDKPWRLRSGSFVPPGAIPDHITLDGKPIFFPGTLDDFEGQGGDAWGYLPAFDDHFYFIQMAAAYAELAGDTDILTREIDGIPLIDRLDRAFHVPPSRADNGLVHCEADNRGVTFGFVDTITHTGDVLFASLLKYQAADEMARFYERIEKPDKASEYHDVAAMIRMAIPATFATGKGLLRASTVTSGQPDVWGSAYAVYIGAVDEAQAGAVCKALAQAYRDGSLAWRGNIRHVITTDDYSSTTAWEKALCPKNRYQNGAYWGTPTGWVCYAMAQTDFDLARKLANEYIAELREGDYRKGSEFGSPWECMHPDGNHRQNPVYMAGVTCTYAAFKRIEREKERCRESVQPLP
ncbi:MAG TPA: hypothetical protein P5318_02290 [Candidatus Hydrogenedentes bacterium]|nr:hypothetical protein [Candidatus Hydrogenedentota bacterium]HRT18929.1 hypothetical protein [Candidatus Hydrogenedentota bacterium]HRT64959.1 hypothetical protein [Candidatus Hydrogenedentota bacterium]